MDTSILNEEQEKVVEPLREFLLYHTDALIEARKKRVSDKVLYKEEINHILHVSSITYNNLKPLSLYLDNINSLIKEALLHMEKERAIFEEAITKMESTEEDTIN